MPVTNKRRRSWWRRIAFGALALCIGGCAVLLLVGAVTSTLGRLPRDARWGMVTVSALSHATIYSSLTLLFGRSLLRGRTPLVTILAGQVHALTPRIRAYTRHVTLVWAMFGVMQVLGSALLLTLAPLRVWSIFVNGLDLPLVLLLFAAEYVYRRLRYPPDEIGSLAETIRVTRSRFPR
ncbi:hypothetical protein [Acidisoma cladoniae]|jgi:uncharacterized membrane protein|uniref:hypothetical protein n=1 Tax=Acidisoma cladoniae TaxID=3040935 RepID=UPI00254B9C1F|nr:hypothetical protein [Acidisoma sp. PAMC 29798]